MNTHYKNMNIKVAALVNDTVGTLAAHAYNDPETFAGIILGTGTNAAYVEQMGNIPKWKGPIVPCDEMLINTEVNLYKRNLIQVGCI